MVNPKLSGMLIGVVIVGLIASVFGLMLANLNTTYNTNYNDNESLGIYNKLDNITSEVKKTKEQTEDIKEKTNVLDIIGSYFTSAFQSLQTSLKGIDVFVDITEKGIDDAGLGATGRSFKTAITTIGLTLLFIGVVISVLVAKKTGEI